MIGNEEEDSVVCDRASSGHPHRFFRHRVHVKIGNQDVKIKICYNKVIQEIYHVTYILIVSDNKIF